MELIIMDEQGAKMHATVRSKLVHVFKQQLNEGDAVMLRMYSLGQTQPTYQVVPNPIKLNFVSKTQVSQCVDFKGSIHGFVFKPFKEILQCQTEAMGQFDVIGQVIESPDLDNYGGNGNQEKKKPLKLMDLEGTELNCMLWGDHADQFTEFLKSCDDVGLLIVVIQLGAMQVQNAFFGTKLFMHNGKESIMNNDMKEIEDFRQSLLLRPNNEQSTNTALKISIASKFSAHDKFLTKYPLRNIDELIDLLKGEVSVIVATVILIQEEEGWWYLGCRKCNKKVVRVDEVLDPEDKDASASVKGTNGYFCKTCDVPCSSVVTRLCMQCRVQDEIGTASLVLFEKENGKLDEFPSDFNRIIDRKYAFKINMNDCQLKKELPSWTIQIMSDDPEIINALILVITPSKDQTSDVVVKDTNVPQLDLASVMDDNGTPSELLKSIASTPTNSGSTNKHNGDGVLGDEGSNTKRQLIEEMGEKN
ncbi:replication protein A 70 kDa DNA-binding subunit B [Tanacetum coccineum]